MPTLVDRINIHDPVKEICQRLGIDETYVSELTIRPDAVTALLFRGRDGSCLGAKYIDLETGKAVMETLDFEVLA